MLGNMWTVIISQEPDFKCVKANVSIIWDKVFKSGPGKI